MSGSSNILACSVTALHFKCRQFRRSGRKENISDSSEGCKSYKRGQLYGVEEGVGVGKRDPIKEGIRQKTRKTKARGKHWRKRTNVFRAQVHHGEVENAMGMLFIIHREHTATDTPRGHLPKPASVESDASCETQI